MSEEKTSIHDLELLCKYFANLDRQGPGSPEVTQKALSFVENLNEQSKIADIGCGSGGQTMVLAQHTSGSITGVDLFPIFVDQFNHNAEQLNLQDRVKGLVGPSISTLRSVEVMKTFLKEHAGNKAAEDFIANQRHEMDLYYKYKDFYGYVFYIGKKLPYADATAWERRAPARLESTKY